jgi:hypothetical protein
MTSPVRLSLVSHTNVGKTTLARTLLGRDVGEVKDAPHVTEFVEMHVLLRTDAGDELQLADTPGFGDSVRLVRRLRQRETPLGWFLSEVWDRWRDRPFWSAQQALRHVRDESDVVLYLANAAESPAAAGYVAPEMEMLAWVGKPVLVLLNQLGAPRAASEEAADLARWRTHFASFAQVRDVLPLDAFARCWVQEGALLRAIERALGGDARLQRLHHAWARQRLDTYDAAMRELAASPRTHRRRARAAGRRRLEPGRTPAARPAQRRASRRAHARRCAGRRGARQHGAAPRAARHRRRAERTILERVAAQIEVREPVHEGRSALLGGAMTGALSGLAADLMSGGLTLGGGMLAGGLLGALGGAGVAARSTSCAARARATRRGATPRSRRWSMRRCCATSPWRTSAAAAGSGPKVKRRRTGADVVDDVLAPQRDALTGNLGEPRDGLDNADEAEHLAAALAPVLGRATRSALERLYPGAWPG